MGQKSETFTAGLCPSLRCVPTGTDGARFWKHGFGNISGKGTAVSCEETAWADRVRKPITHRYLWANLDSTDASAIAAMSKGHICSLSPMHWPLPHCALGDSIRADFHMPMATGQSTSFQSRLALLWMQLQTSPSTCPHPLQPQWHSISSSSSISSIVGTLATTATTTSVPLSCWGRLVWSRQSWSRSLWGWNHS